jgi:hypothetical protein
MEVTSLRYTGAVSALGQVWYVSIYYSQKEMVRFISSVFVIILQHLQSFFAVVVFYFGTSKISSLTWILCLNLFSCIVARYDVFALFS